MKTENALILENDDFNPGTPRFLKQEANSAFLNANLVIYNGKILKNRHDERSDDADNATTK